MRPRLAARPALDRRAAEDVPAVALHALTCRSMSQTSPPDPADVARERPVEVGGVAGAMNSTSKPDSCERAIRSSAAWRRSESTVPANRLRSRYGASAPSRLRRPKQETSGGPLPARLGDRGSGRDSTPYPAVSVAP